MKKRTSHNKIVNQNNLHLSIQFSLDGFSFCIHQNKELVLLKNYTFEETCSSQELLTKVQDIFKEDESLHFNFESIRVIHKNSFNTFVPNEYFDEKRLKSYLKYSIKTFSSDYFIYDDIDSLAIKNVFIPFVNVNNYLLDHFGNFNYYHHQTLLLEKLISEYSKDQKQVFLHFEDHLLDIVITEGDSFLFSNSFEVHNEKDFIYYTLFVLEQLQLDANSIQINLIGSFSKDSEYYKIVFKYIKEIKILESTNSIFDTNSDFHKSELFLYT